LSEDVLIESIKLGDVLIEYIKNKLKKIFINEDICKCNNNYICKLCNEICLDKIYKINHLFKKIIEDNITIFNIDFPIKNIFNLNMDEIENIRFKLCIKYKKKYILFIFIILL